MSTPNRDAAAAKAQAKRTEATVTTGGEAPQATGMVMATLAVYAMGELTEEKHGELGKYFSHICFNGLNFKGEPMMTKKDSPMATISFLIRNTAEYQQANGNVDAPKATVLISNKDGKWKGLPYIANFGGNVQAQVNAAESDTTPLDMATAQAATTKNTNKKAKTFKTVYISNLEEAMTAKAWDYMKKVCTAKFGMVFPAGMTDGGFTRPEPEIFEA